jgi:hypothetical protein
VGGISREVTVTAMITAIDRKAHTVTLTGPKGDSKTVKAQDPRNLDLIQAGDLVDITYTQALAVSVDTPSK